MLTSVVQRGTWPDKRKLLDSPQSKTKSSDSSNSKVRSCVSQFGCLFFGGAPFLVVLKGNQKETQAPQISAAKAERKDSPTNPHKWARAFPNLPALDKSVSFLGTPPPPPICGVPKGSRHTLGSFLLPC